MPTSNYQRLQIGLLTFAMFTKVAVCADAVDFSTEILPVLSDNCFKCHGPDGANREAGLRLDEQDGAFAELDSGERAIVAGNADASELFARLISDDEDLRMPPIESGKQLTAIQIQKIKQWIEQGANWSGHWAFQTPVRPQVPDVTQVDSKQLPGNNPIDRFIQFRLANAGLTSAPRANKATLIRRVTLDLTGLLPTVDEVDAFLADTSADAYEHLIDRLLDSPKYGEHMGRHWLDAARYADTHGLHLDNERSMWPYRKWVIDAFNANKPFDEFTIEQLAGDLLTNPSLDQIVATGFNRCNVTTSEGGSIDEEYYVRYAIDRVETTSTVWLGLTAGCAACHDHKFDPLTQKEFYQLFSYFFSLTEKAMDGNALLPPPSVKVSNRVQAIRKSELTKELELARQKIDAAIASVDYQDPLSATDLAELRPTFKSKEVVWIDDELPAGAEPVGPWEFVSAPDHPVFSGKKSSTRTGDGLTQHFFTKGEPGLEIGAHDILFAYVYIDPKNKPETVQLQFNDGSWDHRAYWGADKAHGKGSKGPKNHRMGDLPKAGEWVRLEVPVHLVGLQAGSKVNGWAFTQFNGTVHWDQAGIVSFGSLSDNQLASLSAWGEFRRVAKQPPLPKEIQTIIDLPTDQRNVEQSNNLTRYYLRNVNSKSISLLKQPFEREAKIKQQLDDLEKTIPATLVMKERDEPRQAHVLERGEYTLKRDKVSSRVPDWLPNQLTEAPENRLGLAQWLVQPSHPLTSRVTVNRIWQQHFGLGLVKTTGDFGVQGNLPSHPKLLDWLATEFIATGWDIKRFHKLILTSETYKQSSNVTPQKLALDPDNRLLSRGPRFRLDAEIVRDNALAVSGLLVDRIGGKSVKPYQPDGLWKPVGFGGSNTSVFKQDQGKNLYRRSMYTFWKRTSPPPSMITFDAPDRETCTVRRARTNTPLQALVLMNDVQFIEAARSFAERVMRKGGERLSDKMTFAFRSATARQPNQQELESLIALYQDYLNDFNAQPKAANELVGAGESTHDKTLKIEELAAWTMMTHLILNLDETITKG